MSTMCFKNVLLDIGEDRQIYVDKFLNVSVFSDSDLAVGEMTCVDRCVGKYMEAQEKVSEVCF